MVTMFTGYLVGYAAFRALFNHSPVMVPSNRPLFVFLHLLQLTIILSIIFFVSWRIIEIDATLKSLCRMLLEAFLDWLVRCL